jgi:hypothetical protein
MVGRTKVGSASVRSPIHPRLPAPPATIPGIAGSAVQNLLTAKKLNKDGTSVMTTFPIILTGLIPFSLNNFCSFSAAICFCCGFSAFLISSCNTDISGRMFVILFDARIWSIAHGATAARMRNEAARMTSQAGKVGKREENPTNICWIPPIGSQNRPMAEAGIVARARAAWLVKGSARVSNGREVGSIWTGGGCRRAESIVDCGIDGVGDNIASDVAAGSINSGEEWGEVSGANFCSSNIDSAFVGLGLDDHQ